MQDWIVILALAVALLSLLATAAVEERCRRMRREKDRGIACALRDRDRLIGELDRVRAEQKTLERVLSASLAVRPEPEALTKPNLKPDDP